MYRRRMLLWAGLAALLASGYAQDPAGAPAAPHITSPAARITSAKTAYIKNAGGSDVPFNVISEGVEGWGRFQIVNTPEKSDIIIEITSPAGGRGVSVSSTTSTDPRTGLPVGSSTTSHELSVSRITLIVYDAKSNVALWSASEQPKGAMRQKTRKDNIVLAAQRLVAKFREQVEPAAAK